MSADEWAVDRLDLDGYLARIGYGKTLAATGATLIALHRAHVAAIGFENLDLVLDRGIKVDLDSVQDKLVHRRRGGYCYEHGVLFAAVLERVGFGVDRLLARIGHDPLRPRPRTHMTLHVRGAGQQWLADVGFGAGLLEPLPWDDSGAAQHQAGWTYQLTPTAPGQWQLRERQSDWTVLYSFTDEPQHASDIEMANHFTSTHPSSPFLGQPVVMRKTADAHERLLGRLLSITPPAGSPAEYRLDDAEVTRALRERFGLALTERQVAAVIDTLPPV